jgi:hypothetical protein
MKAKLINENALSYDIWDIAAVFQTMIDGDDVEYEGASEREIKKIEKILGHDIYDLAEEDYIAKLDKSEIDKIYLFLKKDNWIY